MIGDDTNSVKSLPHNFAKKRYTDRVFFAEKRERKKEKVNNEERALLSEIWEAYECGRDYKSRIGLYERVAENERFYRGDQWRGVESEGLPTPVFNLVRRVATYLVSSVLGYKISVRFDDSALALKESSPARKKARDNLETLSKLVCDRWERQGMDKLFREALTDAVISGDGVFYCWFDDNALSDIGHRGDVRTSLVDSVDLFAADMNSPDIQSQDYVILSGRSSVAKLRAQARRAGLSETDIMSIVPESIDGERVSSDGELYENEDDGAGKCRYLIRFTRDERGYVKFEKVTKNVVLSNVKTHLRYYPIVLFNWETKKHSLHGNSPITEMIGNQKYVNKAFAMEMKHMIDSAFSKVIYDKRLIPEWNNEVGQAIGVMSGGDVSGAVTTVGVGQMQEGYIDIIDRVITYTKELSGATDTALGEVDPTNTSAILALREAADLPLDGVRSELYRAIEELSLVWVDMAKEYMPSGVKYLFGDQTVGYLDFSGINVDDIRASAVIGTSRRYSSSVMLSTLNSLLEKGHINFEEYLEQLPDGVIDGRDVLLRGIRGRKANEEDERSEVSKGEGENGAM